MTKPTKRLGRGLASLVSDLRTTDLEAADSLRKTKSTPGEAPPQLEMESPDIDRLSPNPFQPRQTIPDAGLISLAESLKTSGMIQPISARRSGNRLEIIAGERRWRAARLAGLRTVPVIVRQVDDREMLEMALIENIQREDLNPMDRAGAYRQYCDRFELSPEAVARRLGEDRTTVTNYLRLLELEDEIKSLVTNGQLSMGHARCIVGLPQPATRLRLAQAVVAHNLSVRALEAIARREKDGGSGPAKPSPSSPETTAHLRDLDDRLSIATGTKVTVQEGRPKGSGRIVIEYYTLDDFDRIAGLLGMPPAK